MRWPNADKPAVRAGLVRSYISGVEDGYIVPAVGALEKIARVLEVPFHRLFYDGDTPPPLLNLPNRLTADDVALGIPGEESASFIEFHERTGTVGDPRRSVCLAEARIISIHLSELCPRETRDSVWHQNGHKNLIQNGLDAANKS